MGDPGEPTPQASVYVLRLYVGGGTSPASTRTVQRIVDLCERHLAGRYELDVIDAYVRPHELADEDVVALPTLVRRSPGPHRKLVGDLSDAARVLRGLDLDVPDRPGDESHRPTADERE